jgi:glucose-1-phosphate cytidylyltransferase
MKAVILAGGLGTRMREETEYRPKPMVELMGQPLLFHIMGHLSGHGISEFVVAAGYKSNMIRDYFANFSKQFLPIEVHTSQQKVSTSAQLPDWKVTVIDTGLDSETSDRLLAVRNFLDEEDFLVTYGDGITNANVTAELEFHRQHQKLATVVTTRPKSRFGILELEPDGSVIRFREKPRMEDWVSSGLFVFSPKVLTMLEPHTMFENSLIPKLAENGDLSAFRHDGFWEPVDTYRELKALQKMASNGELPWLEDKLPKLR